MSQFPQPTRPVDSSDLITTIQFPQAPQHVHTNDFHPGYSSIHEERPQFILSDNNLMPQTTATEEEEKQAIEDLTRVISEWYEKLPESIRSQINWDKFNVSSNNNTTEQTDFQVEPTKIRSHNRLLEEFKHRLERFNISIESNASRGINGLPEDLRKKLERFKIRTVQLGEVTQEEVQR